MSTSYALVLVVGSGMSFHNMAGYGDPRYTEPSRLFDDWLTTAVASPAADRELALARWAEAPAARASHPREEHLIPLMVVAGSSGGVGRSVYRERVLETWLSGYEFAG